MTTFTINTGNNITAYAKRPAETEGAETFDSLEAFTALAEAWPGNRLVAIWNTFGGDPVKKFTSRYTGVTRIWKEIQHLTPTPAPDAPKAAAKKAKAVTGATKADEADTARDGSKKATVLDLLRRPTGASLSEIMTTTGWQAHTVRGFISGMLTKKLGLTVESLRGEDKVRTYRIAS